MSVDYPIRRNSYYEWARGLSKGRRETGHLEAPLNGDLQERHEKKRESEREKVPPRCYPLLRGLGWCHLGILRLLYKYHMKLKIHLFIVFPLGSQMKQMHPRKGVIWIDWRWTELHLGVLTFNSSLSAKQCGYFFLRKASSPSKNRQKLAPLEFWLRY